MVYRKNIYQWLFYGSIWSCKAHCDLLDVPQVESAVANKLSLLNRPARLLLSP
jgi:hypothetical protein